jgi:hypothetical protein
MPDADLAVDDLNRNEFVPRDSLGQANVVEGFSASLGAPNPGIIVSTMEDV